MKKIKKEYVIALIPLILFIILAVLVSLGKLDVLDRAVFDCVIKLKGNITTKFLYGITNLVATSGIVIVMFLVALFLLKKKRFSYFKYLIIDVGLGVILMQVIKNIVRRPRPEWQWATQGGYSFPSGHTISAYMLYGTLILLINKKMTGALKYILIIICSIIIFLAGLSRIYLGVHYFSDVVGSLLLGTSILIVTNAHIKRGFKIDKDKTSK